MFKVKRILIVLICYGPHVVYSQNNFSLGLSNYLTTASVRLNPAELGRMKQKWVVAPVTLNASVYNNYYGLDMPYSPFKLVNNSVPKQFTNSKGKAYRNWNWVRSNAKVEKINFYSGVQVQGPAIYINSSSWSVGVSQDFNVYNSISGLPSQLADDQLRRLQNGDTVSVNQELLMDELRKPSDIKLIQNIYNSINLSIGRSFEIKHDKTLSFGVSYKILNSLGGMVFGLKADEIAIDTQSMNLNFSKPSLSFTELYGRNNKIKACGWGGLDLGVTYVYRNKETIRRQAYLDRHTSYKFKIGASIIDLGKLVYTRTIKTQLDIKYDLDLNVMDNLGSQNPEEFFNQLNKGVDAEESVSLLTEYGGRVKVGLPTRLVVNTDFQLIKKWFISTLYVQNLRSKKNLNNMFVQSVLQVSPRIEMRYAELGLPLTYRIDTRQVTPGFSLRVFNFFMSMQNVLPVFNAKKASEAGIYIGFQISNLPGKFLKKKYGYRTFSKKGCSKF